MVEEEEEEEEKAMEEREPGAGGALEEEEEERDFWRSAEMRSKASGKEHLLASPLQS